MMQVKPQRRYFYTFYCYYFLIFCASQYFFPSLFHSLFLQRELAWLKTWRKRISFFLFCTHLFFSSLFRFINVRPFSILNKNTICAYIFLKIYKKVRTQRMSNWKKWKRRQKNLRRITFSSFLMIYCQLFIFMSDFCFSLSHKVVAVNFKSILFALRLVWVLRIFFVCLFYIMRYW